MSDDLVKQLRESAVGWDGLGFHVDAKRDRDAADRIEQLEAALKRIAEHDMQAIALDALRPGERIREKTND
jgi:hypothetical protein